MRARNPEGIGNTTTVNMAGDPADHLNLNAHAGDSTGRKFSQATVHTLCTKPSLQQDRRIGTSYSQQRAHRRPTSPCDRCLSPITA
jgi:hypothetical protein